MSCGLFIFFFFYGTLESSVFCEYCRLSFLHKLYQSPVSTLKWKLNYQKPTVLLMFSAVAGNGKKSSSSWF